MNKESPTADAPVPLAGTEHAADQGMKQQPAPEEWSVLDTSGSIVEGVTDIAVGMAVDILG